MKKCFHLSIDHMPNWAGLISTLVFAFFIVVVLPQQSELAIANGLTQSIDTSWFYTASDLYRIAESYGPTGREFYILQRWTFDLVWPLVYFAFLFSVSALLFKSIGLSKMSRWILSFVWFSLAFDYIENTMVSLVMFRFPEPTWIIADIAGITTSLKWISLGISFFVLFFLIIIKVIKCVIQANRK